MMKKEYWILGIILILTLGTRLFFAFTTPNFTYDSYFHLRHVEEITANGLPLYQDGLSYGGRELVFLPAFHYFLSVFDLFLPLDIAAKVICNFLITSIIVLVYLIAKKITQREDAAFLSSLMAAFIPILWGTNSVSPAHLFLPLIFLAVYCLMNIKEKSFIYLYLITILIISLTTSATILLVIGLLLYIFLSKLEEKRILKAELELMLVSLFSFLWIQFLFFKNILLTEGPNFIWRNIPTQILSQYFPKLSVLGSLIFIGIVPLITGIFIIYKSLFKERNKNIFLLFSLAISTILLFIFNLIELEITLMFLGVILAILFSQFYKMLLKYTKKTKVNKLKTYFFVLAILIISFSSAYPAISFALEQQTPTQQEMESLIWIKENTPQNTTILSTLKEGYSITYLAERKNMMDAQFFTIKNIETRFSNLNSLFITPHQTHAISLINKYKIDYLLFSRQAKNEYQSTNFPYLDERCFKLIYNKTSLIYQSKCQLTKH